MVGHSSLVARANLIYCGCRDEWLVIYGPSCPLTPVLLLTGVAEVRVDRWAFGEHVGLSPASQSWIKIARWLREDWNPDLQNYHVCAVTTRLSLATCYSFYHYLHFLLPFTHFCAELFLDVCFGRVSYIWACDLQGFVFLVTVHLFIHFYVLDGSGTSSTKYNKTKARKLHLLESDTFGKRQWMRKWMINKLFESYLDAPSDFPLLTI